MIRSYLIQRLNSPTRVESPDAAGNPFSFGGGLLRGGLTEEASQLLGTAFEFDYMGAAEYEYGKVPEALNMMADAARDNKLLASNLEIPLNTIKRHWRDKSPQRVEGTAMVYILAREEDLAEVLDRVEQWARQDSSEDRDWKQKYDVRDWTGLSAALRPANGERPEWDRTNGWLELDNGFMFFSDETMFRNTAKLFGVDVDDYTTEAH